MEKRGSLAFLTKVEVLQKIRLAHLNLHPSFSPAPARVRVLRIMRHYVCVITFAREETLCSLRQTTRAKRNMTLIRRLLERTAQGRKQLIGWLQEERLLAKKKRCPVCNNKMKFKRTNTTKDGYRW